MGIVVLQDDNFTKSCYISL